MERIGIDGKNACWSLTVISIFRVCDKIRIFYLIIMVAFDIFFSINENM